MPINAPETRGIVINDGTKFMPISKVVIIATPIPTIPNIFPDLADVGDDSPLRANIKNIAANK